MSQYKEANERMNYTGDGLEGIEFENFQDYIVNSICKYYFVLDPVLKDRPNVRPWITNEDNGRVIGEPEEILSVSSSDDESMQSNGLTSDEKTKLNDQMLDDIIINHTTDNEYKTHHSNLSFSTVSSNNHTSTPSTTSDSSNTSEIETVSTTQRSIDTNMTPTRSKKKDKKNIVITKISPMQAKNYQNKLKNRKKKSIVKKKGSASKVFDAIMDTDDRDFIMESRNATMIFEKEKYNHMKSIESEKLRIDKERLKMEMNSTLIKQQQEKSRLVLLRLEMFKERQSIKKEYPEITDDFLEANFPYPE